MHKIFYIGWRRGPVNRPAPLPSPRPQPTAQHAPRANPPPARATKRIPAPHILCIYVFYNAYIKSQAVNPLKSRFARAVARAVVRGWARLGPGQRARLSRAVGWPVGWPVCWPASWPAGWAGPQDWVGRWVVGRPSPPTACRGCGLWALSRGGNSLAPRRLPSPQASSLAP